MDLLTVHPQRGVLLLDHSTDLIGGDFLLKNYEEHVSKIRLTKEKCAINIKTSFIEDVYGQGNIVD